MTDDRLPGKGKAQREWKCTRCGDTSSDVVKPPRCRNGHAGSMRR